MPPVVALVASALVYIGVGAATAAIAASIIVSVGISLISSAIGSLLKPKQSNLSERGDTLTFRAPTEAARVIYGQTRVGGPILLIGTTDNAGVPNAQLHMVIALAGHEVEEIGDVYFNGELVPLSASGAATGFYQGFVRVKKWLGGWDQTADPDLIAAFPGQVTEAHRFRGIACLYVRLTHDPNGKFAQGVPTVTALVKGRKVYDPRDVGQTIADPSTWKWSDNAVLCALDYIRGVPMRLMTTAIERPYGLGPQMTDDDIDLTNIGAEANVADELVTVIGGGTQRRYTMNGTVDTDVAPNEILAHMRAAMAGSIHVSGGQFQIECGYWRPPTLTLTDDDLAGPKRTQVRRQSVDLFSGVKGVYVGPLNNFQPADFPSVQDALAVAEDNGEERWADVEFPFTNTPAACQRLAWIMVQENRQQIVIDRRLKLSALATRVGDVVAVNDDKRGWSSKPFKITSWSLVTEAGDGGAPACMIDVTAVETASAIYDWDGSLERQVDAAPDTNLPDPRIVSPPGGPGISEANYVTRVGAGVKTRVTVSWAPAAAAFAVDYQLEYRQSGATAWTVLPKTSATLQVFDDFAAGRWDFRVRAINVFGASSAYAESLGLSVQGLSAPPAALSGLQVQAQGNQALLTWTQSVDADVTEGGSIEFRHSPAFTGATWDAATTIRQSVPGAEVSAVVPLKAGSYLVRAVDSTGNPSTISTVTSKQASQHGFTSLAGSPIAEDPGFSGTKTGCSVSGGRLSLSGAGLVDSIPDWDAVADFDIYGGLATEGSYTFATAFNFGAVTRARLTSIIDVSIVSTGDLIDSRTANIDDWDDFDGGVPGAGDAWVEFRQTDDNPSGSPTWTSWMRLDVAEIEAWGVQFRAQLRVDDAAYNIELITLGAKAERIT